MVRKHYRWTRQRQKRTRPKTPAPTNGWILAELAQLTGLPETTVRYYVANKLIRPIQVRGTATRYDRHDLMLLLGIVRLRTDDTLTLKEKKRKLEALGTAELERWLRAGPLSEAAGRALGFETMAISPAASRTAAGGALELRNASVEFSLIAHVAGERIDSTEVTARQTMHAAGKYERVGALGRDGAAQYVSPYP